MSKSKFDVKSWVKKYFGLRSTDKTLDNANNSLEFIWVWAIFEHKYLRDSRDFKKYNDQLIDISAKFPIKKIDIDTMYGFLHKRYFQKGKTTRFFANLNFDNKWLKLTKAILRKQNPTPEEKLKFILLVLFKFRCNLFHGRKDPLLWKNFNEVFYYINKFLADFLDVKWKNQTTYIRVKY
ncbi:hypothetical protein [uncultured Arcticibacterium sp.]|uniref:hypothetical protein n=1 Tax=uncultured Arcticibacterium sp. TaxID=2173042 RepID=UPI0030F68185